MTNLSNKAQQVQKSLIISAEMTSAFAESFRKQKITNREVKEAFLSTKKVHHSENDMFFAEVTYIGNEQFFAIGNCMDGSYNLESGHKRSLTGDQVKDLITFEVNFHLAMLEQDVLKLRKESGKDAA